MPRQSFWKNKRVLVTGDTGFKGAWLCLWLTMLGAKVEGYSKGIPTNPSLSRLLKLDMPATRGDVRDLKKLKKTIARVKPDIVFHLAAQALVRASYIDPVGTFETNVLGTANLLESLRGSPARAAVIITTDKVYDNNEQGAAFKETDPLGGYDPYSASKGAAEMVVASYRNSFFNIRDHGKAHTTLIASVRAGNVIGGGDFAEYRIIPDLVRALLAGKALRIRNPQAIRPWQHVLAPLSGYLLLAEKLFAGEAQYAEAWNFGPQASDMRSVEWIVQGMCARWGAGAKYVVEQGGHPHEAYCLNLNSLKARKFLGWEPRWDLSEALDRIIEWTRAYKNKQPVAVVCAGQIREYSKGH